MWMKLQPTLFKVSYFDYEFPLFGGTDDFHRFGIKMRRSDLAKDEKMNRAVMYNNDGPM